MLLLNFNSRVNSREVSEKYEPALCRETVFIQQKERSSFLKRRLNHFEN